MIVHVKFFKPSGKYYSGGNVDVGDARLWKGNLRDAILKHQQILVPHAPEHYYMVVTSPEPGPGEDKTDNYFAEALYHPTAKNVL